MSVHFKTNENEFDNNFKTLKNFIFQIVKKILLKIIIKHILNKKPKLSSTMIIHFILFLIFL